MKTLCVIQLITIGHSSLWMTLTTNHQQTVSWSQKNKTTIKANLSEETETDDEKASDENDGMDIEDNDDNDTNETQMTSEVDDKSRAKANMDKVGDADGIDRKEETTEKKSKTNWFEKVVNKRQTIPATNTKLQVSLILLLHKNSMLEL